MGIYHLSVKMHSGSKGQSAVAMIAYRSGERLTDQATGIVSDYTKKEGVLYSEIILPEHIRKTHPEYLDRETLWNEIQKVEKNRGQFSREFEVALPKELSFEQQLEVVREFSSILVSEGMIVDFSIHAPRKISEDETNNNTHAHISCSTRQIDQDGNWCKKRTTMYALDKNGQKIPEIDKKTGKQKVVVREGHGVEKKWVRESVAANDWNKKEKILEWRKEWENVVNNGLIRAGNEERVDCRSLKEQGIERIPQIHVGVAGKEIDTKKNGRCNVQYFGANIIKREIQSLLKLIETLKLLFQDKFMQSLDAVYKRCKSMEVMIEKKGENRKMQNTLIIEKNHVTDLIDKQIEELKKELSKLEALQERNFEKEKEIYERLERLRTARATDDITRGNAERIRADERRQEERRREESGAVTEYGKKTEETKKNHRRR